LSVTLPDQANLEPGEVLISSLPAGATFTMGKLRGVVLQQCPCSTLVKLKREGFKVIETGDGSTSGPIKLSDRVEHWSQAAGVIPIEEEEDSR